MLAIKIDIDTLKGYLEGLPALLKILREHDIKASIFFSLGYDNSGKALRRIFRKGFISKMLRTKAPSTYGLKTLFYGTLLKAPEIVNSNPDLLKQALDEGHDCGVHAWDHVYWQDNLYKLTREQIFNELEKAVNLFEKISGVHPKSCAAPGWQVSPDSLSVQDDFNFDYCSDTRGKFPFMPLMNNIKFKTPQIPSTLPTLDEILGTNNLNADNVNDYYIANLKDGLNVHTIHTEMEGRSMSKVFSNFLDRCLNNGVKFSTLKDALTDKNNLPVNEVKMREIFGRAGKVAVQI